MDSNSIYKCINCEKVFANNASLNVHKKTAKYCKQIQLTRNTDQINDKHKYTCDYCEKECTTCSNLKVHMKTCSAKNIKEKYDDLHIKYCNIETNLTEQYGMLQEQYAILQEKYNKQTEEITNLKYSLEWEKDQNASYKSEYKVITRELSILKKQSQSSDENLKEIINEKEKCIVEKDKHLSYRDNQIEEYKKEKDRLYSILNIKEEEFKQKECEMKQEIKQKEAELKKERKKKDSDITKAVNKLVNSQSSTTYIGNTVINNAYNTEFNQLFQNLPNFTDLNVKERVSSLNHDGIIFSNDYNVDFNFASKLANVIKDLTFCTDQSRGKLIIKTEDGKQRTITAEEFVLECIGKSGDECKRLLVNTFRYCEQQFKEKKMFEDEYHIIKAKLAELIGCMSKPTISNSIKHIPNLVIKHCKQLSKRNVQQIDNLLDENHT